MNLNSEQDEAVRHFQGPCLVTAVPGSGKTRVLTARVVHLIKECHIPAKNILCTTFTNRAANEMKQRVRKECEELSEGAFIGTFHALCRIILIHYGHLIGLPKNFTIYDDRDQNDLIAKLAIAQGFNYNQWQIKEIAKIANDYREDLENGKQLFKDSPGQYQIVIEKYLKDIDRLDAVDFSGLLHKCYQVLQKQQVVDVLSNRFRFIMVDESQDMNVIQYEITKRLGPHGNILWVGDPDQSIFAWRNAKPDILENIDKDFPDVNRVVLPRNYRSTPEILEAAQCLIRHNPNASNVRLVAENPSGIQVCAHEMLDSEAEADYVVSTMCRMRRNDNLQWKDFTVLYRVNNESQLLEQKCRQLGVPYKIVGGMSFFDRREIKTVLSYLRVLANPVDIISFLRAISEPKRGVGKASVIKVEEFCNQNNCSIVEACLRAKEISGLTQTARRSLSQFGQVMHDASRDMKDKPLVRVASELLTETGYMSHMEEESTRDSIEEKRIENIRGLLDGIRLFANKHPDAGLSDYLQSVEIFTEDKEEDGDVVSLLTMHSSKGLEFPVVFVIGCNEGLIPHRRAVAERGLHEERRLMYVAVTRCQSCLIITYRQRGSRYGDAPLSPSPFLYEAGLCQRERSGYGSIRF